MMKWISLLILTTPQLIFAEVDFAAGLEALSEGPRVTCNNPTLSKYKLHKDYSNKGADCSKFITSSGEFGSHGKILRDHLSKINGSKLFDSKISGMSDLCPNWAKLSKQDKEYFWVWFFAAIAREESTCSNTAVTKGAKNGTAVGYFQLDAVKKDRYWKSGKSGKSCAVVDVKPVTDNIKCALEIFNEQLKGLNGVFEGNGQLAGKGSRTYWQDLRKDKDKRVVYKLAGKFPGCK